MYIGIIKDVWTSRIMVRVKQIFFFNGYYLHNFEDYMVDVSN